MAVDSTKYLSNPIDMIKPSTRAMGVNVGTFFALLGIMFLPGLLLIVAAITGIAGRNGGTNIIALILGMIAIVAIIALALIMVPAVTIVLMASAQGQKIKARTALSQARPFVLRSLGISILTSLAVVGGFLLFVIPGFIFMAWFSLGMYVLVTENLGVVESMKRSKVLVRGRVWEIWGISSIAVVVTILPVIGSTANFILSVLMAPALPIRYLQLSSTAPEERPKVHWANYAIIVIALLALVFSAGMANNDLQDLNGGTSSTTDYSF